VAGFFWPGFEILGLRGEHHWGPGLQNGRKLALSSGLLRNSTIFAAQKLGFEQCSQNPPGGEG